jgi:hypothetical protein
LASVPPGGTARMELRPPEALVVHTQFSGSKEGRVRAVPVTTPRASLPGADTNRVLLSPFTNA